MPAPVVTRFTSNGAEGHRRGVPLDRAGRARRCRRHHARGKVAGGVAQPRRRRRDLERRQGREGRKVGGRQGRGLLGEGSSQVDRRSREGRQQATRIAQKEARTFEKVKIIARRHDDAVALFLAMGDDPTRLDGLPEPIVVCDANLWTLVHPFSSTGSA
jgi:hypothetical protein